MEKKVKIILATSLILLVLPTSYGAYLLCNKDSNTEDSSNSVSISDSDALNSNNLFSNNSNRLGRSNASGELDNASFLTGKKNSGDLNRIDNINAGYKLVSLSSEQLEVQRLRDTKMKEQRKKWKLASPMMNIKFSSKYSQNFKDINTAIYQIVQKYFCPSNFSDTEYSQYIDPLYIMAISNVEFGDATNPEVLLAPAVPTNKGVEVSKDNILTFGYSDYLKYPKVLTSDRDEYRGPMQIYVTGQTKAIKPSELLSCEWVQLQNAEDCEAKSAESSSPQFVEGSGTVAHVDGMILQNKAGVYGDRWNYADCVNRLSGTIHEYWDQYEKLDCNKDGDHAIDSKYAWMAMSAIGHNASPGIFYCKDNIDISGSYYWWPFGPYEQARKYAHYLGTDDCVNYIQSKAEEALHSYRNGKSLKFRLSRQDGFKMAEDMVSKNYMPSGLWKHSCWNHEEKVGYPIQVLYNYFILKGIYSGE